MDGGAFRATAPTDGGTLLRERSPDCATWSRCPDPGPKGGNEPDACDACWSDPPRATRACACGAPRAFASPPPPCGAERLCNDGGGAADAEDPTGPRGEGARAAEDKSAAGGTVPEPMTREAPESRTGAADEAEAAGTEVADITYTDCPQTHTVGGAGHTAGLERNTGMETKTSQHSLKDSGTTNIRRRVETHPVATGNTDELRVILTLVIPRTVIVTVQVRAAGTANADHMRA